VEGAEVEKRKKKMRVKKKKKEWTLEVDRYRISIALRVIINLFYQWRMLGIVL